MMGSLIRGRIECSYENGEFRQNGKRSPRNEKTEELGRRDPFQVDIEEL